MCGGGGAADVQKCWKGSRCGLSGVRGSSRCIWGVLSLSLIKNGFMKRKLNVLLQIEGCGWSLLCLTVERLFG